MNTDTLVPCSKITVDMFTHLCTLHTILLIVLLYTLLQNVPVWFTPEWWFMTLRCAGHRGVMSNYDLWKKCLDTHTLVSFILKGGKQLLATDFSSDDENVTLSNINLKQDLANRQQTHINVSLSNITLWQNFNPHTLVYFIVKVENNYWQQISPLASLTMKM